jgi:hypothetical protein
MAERTQPGGREPATQQQIIDVLNDIFDQVKNQVQSKTPPPLTGAALQAANAFKEISDALDVKAVGSSSPPR